MDMNEKIATLTMTKACKVSADEDSKDAPKTVHLTVDFSGVTVGQVFAKAMSSVIIAWQTKARKNFASIKDGSSVTVKFVAPAQTTVDPIEATASWFASASDQEKQEYLKKLGVVK